MKSVLLISHGSRSSKTEEEIKLVCDSIRKSLNEVLVDYAFLELQKPSIDEGIDSCVKRGATTVILLLNFLNSGTHVDIDIPEIVRQAEKKYPAVSFRMTKPLGLQSRTVNLFLEILNEENF